MLQRYDFFVIIMQVVLQIMNNLQKKGKNLLNVTKSKVTKSRLCESVRDFNKVKVTKKIRNLLCEMADVESCVCAVQIASGPCPMHEVVPSAVSAAVRMLMMT